MTTTQKRTAAATAAVLAVGGLVYYFTATAPQAPQLTAQGFAGVVELSWPAKTNELYSIGFTSNLVAPEWREIWYGCLAAGAVIRSNFELNAHPPTADEGSCWAPVLTYTNGEPPMSNQIMRRYFSIETNQQGYFHLWTRSVGTPVKIPLNITRTP